MRIRLRRARLDVVRWRCERDARAHVSSHLADPEPLHIGEWHTDDRVSSIIAMDPEGKPLWSALMAEGERDPWVVPTFGGLLFISRENLLLIDDCARIVAQESASYEFADVLIGETVVWVVGWHDAMRVTAAGLQVFEPSFGSWDGWRFEGDRLLGLIDGREPEIIG